MKLTITKYLNARIGEASTNAPCQVYRNPGDFITVDDIIIGTEIDGNNIWYKNKDDECFYWSGGLEEKRPAYFSDFGINYLWNDTMGQGVKVFVVDSGVKNYDGLTLPDKNFYSVLPSQDKQDIIGHGTLMSSIIGGIGVDKLGIAVKAEIISVKITNSKSEVNKDVLSKALNTIESLLVPDEYCVINLSLTLGINKSEFESLTVKLNRIANLNNTIIVAAVGNDSYDRDDYKTFPALLKDLVSVAGLNPGPYYNRLPTSNYWNDIIIAGPGDYPKSELNGIFPLLENQGSSHAAAFVSGLAALFLSKAKMKNLKITSAYFQDFLRNASMLTTETSAVDLRQFSYYKLDKNKLIKTFKTV